MSWRSGRVSFHAGGQMCAKLVGGVAVAVVGLALAAGLPPLITVARYQEAAQDGRADVLARLSDFPVVRTGLRRQIAARLLHELRRDGELIENPLGGFGLALAPALSDIRAEMLASPGGVAVLIVTGDPPRTSIEAAYPPAAYERGPVTRRLEVRGLREVCLTVRPRSAPVDRTTALVFRPYGLTAWRLVSIELPPGG